MCFYTRKVRAMKKDDFYIEPTPTESPAERAERYSRRRKIKKVVVIIVVIAIIIAVGKLLPALGPFDPRGLIKSRNPMWG